MIIPLLFALMAAIYIAGKIDLSGWEKDAKRFWRRGSA